jgi:hypothetical protein
VDEGSNMLESSVSNLDRITKIIVAIGLTPKNIMHYEECEIITDLMDVDIINEVPDPELGAILKRMRVLHEDIRKMNHAEFIRTATELFQRIPKKEYVLKYHDAEQISKLLPDEDVIHIKDEQLRETIQSLKHVHNHIAEKKANVIKRMNLY